jgi:hypothetical protein
MEFRRIFCHALSRKSVGANVEYGSVTKDRAEARHRRLYRLHAPRLSSSHEDDQRSQQQRTTDLPDPLPVGRAPPCRWLERSRVVRIRTCNGRSRLLAGFFPVKGCEGKRVCFYFSIRHMRAHVVGAVCRSVETAQSRQLIANALQESPNRSY